MQMKFWIVYGPPHWDFAGSVGHKGMILDDDKERIHHTVDQFIENKSHGLSAKSPNLNSVELDMWGAIQNVMSVTECFNSTNNDWTLTNEHTEHDV